MLGLLTRNSVSGGAGLNTINEVKTPQKITLSELKEKKEAAKKALVSMKKFDNLVPSQKSSQQSITNLIVKEKENIANESPLLKVNEKEDYNKMKSIYLLDVDETQTDE